MPRARRAAGAGEDLLDVAFDCVVDGAEGKVVGVVAKAGRGRRVGEQRGSSPRGEKKLYTYGFSISTPIASMPRSRYATTTHARMDIHPSAVHRTSGRVVSHRTSAVRRWTTYA